jgi:hypothetical protein
MSDLSELEIQLKIAQLKGEIIDKEIQISVIKTQIACLNLTLSAHEWNESQKNLLVNKNMD